MFYKVRFLRAGNTAQTQRSILRYLQKGIIPNPQS